MLRIILIAGSLFWFYPSYAQSVEGDIETKDEEQDEVKQKLSPFLIGGVMAGGHADRGNFVFTEGITVNAGLLWKRNKRVSIGFSLGVDKLKQTYFLPVGFMAMGYTKKKDESAFFAVNAGYAPVVSHEIYRNTNYTFIGGLFFQPMFGYKFNLKGNDLLIGLAYKHQFGELRYKGERGNTFREENNYHLISFRAGIIF